MENSWKIPTWLRGMNTFSPSTGPFINDAPQGSCLTMKYERTDEKNSTYEELSISTLSRIC